MAGLDILVLSNFYPPRAFGGYELGCSEVVEGLRARGHTLRVLTSADDPRRPSQSGGVYRWLRSDFGWRARSQADYWATLYAKEWHSRAAYARLCRARTPQVLYVWNMRYLSLAPVLMAQRRGTPVCYYASDEWLAQRALIDRWRAPQRRPAARLLKAALDRSLDLLAHPADRRGLRPERVQFTSRHLLDTARESGLRPADARVIHWGVAPERFPPRPPRPGPPARLLYAGQLAEKKGVHTAVEALGLLRAQGRTDLRLTIAGGGQTAEEEARLRALVQASGLDGQVVFAGRLPRAELPAVYQAHDLLIFPSIWDEPFSIALLEGLAAGLAVVGTATGGSAEILRHGQNALVFPRGDAAACAERIAALLDDPDLYVRLCAEGRRTVERRFTLDRMLGQIERALADAVST
jgi:glycosyltransferase involved in cell wall biosynthesis